METQNRAETLMHTADMYIGLLRKFGEQIGGPPETLIFSAGRMAGTLMFRSLGLDVEKLEPGQVILTEAGKLKGCYLTNLVNATLKPLGDIIDEEKAKAALGASSGARAFSKLTLQETQEQFEGLFVALAKTIGLSLPEASAAASVASALLVHQSREVIDINRGYIAAISGHVEALQTVPVRLAEKTKPQPSPQPEQPKAPNAKKRWFKLW